MDFENCASSHHPGVFNLRLSLPFLPADKKLILLMLKVRYATKEIATICRKTLNQALVNFVSLHQDHSQQTSALIAAVLMHKCDVSGDGMSVHAGDLLGSGAST